MKALTMTRNLMSKAVRLLKKEPKSSSFGADKRDLEDRFSNTGKALQEAGVQKDSKVLYVADEWSDVQRAKSHFANTSWRFLDFNHFVLTVMDNGYGTDRVFPDGPYPKIPVEVKYNFRLSTILSSEFYALLQVTRERFDYLVFDDAQGTGLKLGAGVHNICKTFGSGFILLSQYGVRSCRENSDDCCIRESSFTWHEGVAERGMEPGGK